jgi:hypothetical protein
LKLPVSDVSEKQRKRPWKRYPEEEASKISAIADTANVDAQKSWAAVK